MSCIFCKSTEKILIQVLFSPIFLSKNVRQTKKEARVDFLLDALFHYYFVLYTFKGFRDEERMLNTEILLEL